MENLKVKNKSERQDTVKNSTADSSRSNVEHKENNQSENPPKAKSSQAGYTDQSGNARPAQVDPDEASAGVP